MRRVAIAAALGLTHGCQSVPNPAFCCTSTEDCAAFGATDDQQMCALGLVCRDHECVLPPDAALPMCVDSSDCSSPTPICAPNSTCVQCTGPEHCTAVSPVCDDASSTCRGCSANDECASLVCTVSTGLCQEESSIAYASPNGASTAACTKADPCSIQRAVAITDLTRSTVRLAPGAYTGSIVVANKNVVIQGDGATLSSTQAPTIAVNDSGNLQIVGLVIVSTVTGGDQGVVSCASINNVDVPKARFERVSIQGVRNGLTMRKCDATILSSTLKTTGSGSTLTADLGTLATVDRSKVVGGGYTVLATNSSLVRFTSSVIGAPTSGNDAFFPLGGGIGISFSTVFNTRVTCSTGASSCSGGAPNGVCLENSIVANFVGGAPANTVTGSACSAVYSLIFPQAASIAGANNKFGMDPLLKDVANEDVHLLTGSPAIDAADPLATSTVDFDGAPRSQGTADMGAYESP